MSLARDLRRLRARRELRLGRRIHARSAGRLRRAGHAAAQPVGARRPLDGEPQSARSVECGRAAAITFRFHARDLHLVLGAGQGRRAASGFASRSTASAPGWRPRRRHRRRAATASSTSTACTSSSASPATSGTARSPSSSSTPARRHLHSRSADGTQVYAMNTDSTHRSRRTVPPECACGRAPASPAAIVPALGAASPVAAPKPAGPVTIENFSAAGKSEGLVTVERVVKTDAEWRQQLSPASYGVTRQAGTERPFSGELDGEKRLRLYRCICCDTALFDSKTKFDSGTGWPSFWQTHLGPQRGRGRGRADPAFRGQEISCARCDAHLGHVFSDGPQPTGLRYCMNSVALRFIRARSLRCELSLSLILAIAGCSWPRRQRRRRRSPPTTQTAVLAGGCFWGVEGVFEHMRGVQQRRVRLCGRRPEDRDLRAGRRPAAPVMRSPCRSPSIRRK